MVAGHAVWLPGECWPLLSTAPPRTEAGQCGQEDLAEVGRDEVVEDGVDGGADVKESVGQHVEIVVEVVEEPVGEGQSCLGLSSPHHVQCGCLGYQSIPKAFFLGELADLALTIAPFGHGLSTLPSLSQQPLLIVHRALFRSPVSYGLRAHWSQTTQQRQELLRLSVSVHAVSTHADLNPCLQACLAFRSLHLGLLLCSLISCWEQKLCPVHWCLLP